MKKLITMLMIFCTLFAVAIPCFADELTESTDISSIKNVASSFLDGLLGLLSVPTEENVPSNVVDENVALPTNQQKENTISSYSDEVDGYTSLSSKENTTPFYAKEITFRGLPWGISLDKAKEELDIDGNFWESNEAFITSWEACKPQGYDWFDNLYLGHELSCSFYGGKKSLNVAGYPVEYVSLYFAYGLDDGVQYDSKDSEFYLAGYRFDVTDIRGTYEDLKEKLNSIYGEGHKAQADDSIMLWAMYDEMATEWCGANNTGVILYATVTKEGSEFNTDSLVLCYGKTDSQGMLRNIDNAITQEKIAEETKNRNDSIVGL